MTAAINTASLHDAEPVGERLGSLMTALERAFGPRKMNPYGARGEKCQVLQLHQTAPEPIAMPVFRSRRAI